MPVQRQPLMPFRKLNVQGRRNRFRAAFCSSAGCAPHPCYRAACCRICSSVSNVVRSGAAPGDGFGVGRRDADRRRYRRPAAARNPALAGWPVYRPTRDLPAHRRRGNQRADPGRFGAGRAGDRLAVDAAGWRNRRAARSAAWAGDDLPARMGRADRAAYRRRPLSAALSARPSGQPAGPQARHPGADFGACCGGDDRVRHHRICVADVRRRAPIRRHACSPPRASPASLPVSRRGRC